MPATRQPSMSEVYAAFDAAALRVYRAAMARSRNGVVRLSDLLAAVVTAEPETARERLSESGWRLARQPPGPGPAPAPLSNEPAVRAILFRALEEAGARVPVCITPGLLLNALLDVHNDLASRNTSETGRPAPTRVRTTPSRPRSPSDDRTLVDEILRQWLAYQVVSDETQAVEVSRRLQEMLRRW